MNEARYMNWRFQYNSIPIKILSTYSFKIEDKGKDRETFRYTTHRDWPTMLSRTGPPTTRFKIVRNSIINACICPTVVPFIARCDHALSGPLRRRKRQSEEDGPNDEDVHETAWGGGDHHRCRICLRCNAESNGRFACSFQSTWLRHYWSGSAGASDWIGGDEMMPVSSERASNRTVPSHVPGPADRARFSLETNSKRPSDKTWNL